MSLPESSEEHEIYLALRRVGRTKKSVNPRALAGSEVLMRAPRVVSLALAGPGEQNLSEVAATEIQAAIESLDEDDHLCAIAALGVYPPFEGESMARRIELLRDLHGIGEDAFKDRREVALRSISRELATETDPPRLIKSQWGLTRSTLTADHRSALPSLVYAVSRMQLLSAAAVFTSLLDRAIADQHVACPFDQYRDEYRVDQMGVDLLNAVIEFLSVRDRFWQAWYQLDLRRVPGDLINGLAVAISRLDLPLPLTLEDKRLLVRILRYDPKNVDSDHFRRDYLYRSQLVPRFERAAVERWLSWFHRDIRNGGSDLAQVSAQSFAVNGWLLTYVSPDSSGVHRAHAEVLNMINDHFDARMNYLKIAGIPLDHYVERMIDFVPSALNSDMSVLELMSKVNEDTSYIWRNHQMSQKVEVQTRTA